MLAVPRRVLVLDEPTSMLDPAGRDDVLQAVRRLHAEGLSVVYVTQEMDEVTEATRVLALRAGRVAFDGPPAALFADVALVDAAVARPAHAGGGGGGAGSSRARAGRTAVQP